MIVSENGILLSEDAINSRSLRHDQLRAPQILREEKVIAVTRKREVDFKAREKASADNLRPTLVITARSAPDTKLRRLNPL